MDRRGNRYLDPGNPSLADHSRNRAREEEISEEILDKLDWIKGVRVQVQVIASRAAVSDRGARPERPSPPNGRPSRAELDFDRAGRAPASRR